MGSGCSLLDVGNQEEKYLNKSLLNLKFPIPKFLKDDYIKEYKSLSSAGNIYFPLEM